jgi:sulfate adenylyltransferase
VSNSLIQPCGGKLIDLMVDAARAAQLKSASRDWPSWSLSARQICDLELMLNGGFSPLDRFIGSEEYESVCRRMRLADDSLWPVPVTLDVSEELGAQLAVGDPLALRDPEGMMLAVVYVEELWRPDRKAEAQSVYGTLDAAHPGVDYLMRRAGPICVAGRIEGIRLPMHFDFRAWRLTPAEVRAQFSRMGWRKIVAYQTQDTMHRAEHEMTLRAAKQLEANLLIHPVVGATKRGDLDHYTRVRCYEAILQRYPQHTVKLALLPLASRTAGPREALWQAIIRRNYGCTHFMVGNDPLNQSHEAQELVRQHEDETGVQLGPFKRLVYVEDEDAYLPHDEVEPAARVLSLSGEELQRRLAAGREIPAWFSFPEVADALRRRHPPRHRQGFTVFLTGLSGAGKSTIAKALLVKFLEMGGRPVTLLDGDIVRRNLSSELGFSREHRDINIRRIGFVASEITKNGGIAICAPIAPYDAVRKQVREMIEPLGGFILVHVDTPLEVCEARDRKGLYAKARAGLIKEFTGISDPYEDPADADLVIRTTELTPEQAAQEVLLHLESEGFVGVNGGGA